MLSLTMKLLALLVASSDVYAIRGGATNHHRRLPKKPDGYARDGSVYRSKDIQYNTLLSDELDDPEEIAAAQTGGVLTGHHYEKGLPKGASKGGAEDYGDLPEAEDDGKGTSKGGGAKGSKGSKGDSSEPVEYAVEDGSVHANETDSYSDALEVPASPGDALMKRSIPLFAIFYTLSGELPTSMGDEHYNELYVITEQYLNDFFDQTFQGSVASHAYTDVSMELTNEPTRTEWFVVPHFYVPGQVPTLELLRDEIRMAFGDPNVADYLMLLQQETQASNPFHRTSGVRLVNVIPEHVDTGVLEDSGQQGSLVITKGKKSAAAPLLAGIGLLVLAITGFLCFLRWRAKELLQKDQMKLDEESESKPSLYGTDDDTLKYLEAVRERYSTEESSHASSHDGDLADVPLKENKEPRVGHLTVTSNSREAAAL